MPHDVYVVADVNAAVDHVGGWMGIGSRPVMMLGLPLIAVLTVSELRGVIAHEFGHYVGGETRLSSVIYRTREGIGRTIHTLEGSVHWTTQGMRFPFIWYAEMYMRLTQAQSRQHELEADRVAAGIAGGTSMESALVTIHVGGADLRDLPELGGRGPRRCRIPPTARGRVLEVPPTDAHAVGAR